MEFISEKGHPVPREGTKICFTNVCKGLPCIISGSVGVVLYIITQKQEVIFVFMYFLLYCEWASALSTAECCTSTHLSSRNYNPHAYLVPYAHCNTLKFSFFSTVIWLWNCIPVEAYTSQEFKYHISPLFLSP